MQTPWIVVVKYFHLVSVVLDSYYLHCYQMSEDL